MCSSRNLQSKGWPIIAVVSVCISTITCPYLVSTARTHLLQPRHDKEAIQGEGLLQSVMYLFDPARACLKAGELSGQCWYGELGPELRRMLIEQENEFGGKKVRKLFDMGNRLIKKLAGRKRNG